MVSVPQELCFELSVKQCDGLQVQECKAVLVEGLKEQNIRQMWVRKKETDYILAMLDKLEMLKVCTLDSLPFHQTRDTKSD